MILDADTIFQAATASAGTFSNDKAAGTALDAGICFGASTASTVTTKALDFGQGGDAVGNELMLYISVKGILNNGSATTALPASNTVSKATAKLQTSDDGTNWDDMVISPNKMLSKLDLTKVDGGTIFHCRVPHGMKRYARVELTGTSMSTVGLTVLPFLTKDQL